MTTTSRVRIRGNHEAAAHVRGVATNVRDLTPAWPRVGNYLSSRVNRQFLSKGAQFNTPWKPLTRQYLAWKIRNGYPRDILVQTGEMRRSFTSRPMDIEVYTPTSASFGSSNKKALWHHGGTFRNGKRVNPPRKILVVTREVRKDVKDIVRRHILRSGGRVD